MTDLQGSTGGMACSMGLRGNDLRGNEIMRENVHYVTPTFVYCSGNAQNRLAPHTGNQRLRFAVITMTDVMLVGVDSATDSRAENGALRFPVNSFPQQPVSDKAPALQGWSLRHSEAFLGSLF